MNENRQVNLFWPVLLIGVGVLLLLSNLGLMDPINMINLFRLWPLILIALGVKVMFGRDNVWVSNIISILLVAAAVAFVFFAPQLGLPTASRDLMTDEFSEPLNDAASAEIDLDISHGVLEVFGLESDDNLFEVVSVHTGEAKYEVTGEADRFVSFKLDDPDPFNFLFDLEDLFDDSVRTEVGLAAGVPLDLNIDHGAGTANVDLSALTLIDLDSDTGSGVLNVTLPGGEYPANLGAGSGKLNVEVLADAVLDLSAGVGSGTIEIDLGNGVSGSLDVNSGSGTITIYVPENIGIEIRGETGSGSVRLPDGFIRTRGEDLPGPSESGTWRTENFDTAEFVIYIDFSVGSGSIRIVYK